MFINYNHISFGDTDILCTRYIDIQYQRRTAKETQAPPQNRKRKNTFEDEKSSQNTLVETRKRNNYIRAVLT